MKLTLEIPEYDGRGLDVLWDPEARYKISVYGNEVVLAADKSGFEALARQLLYLAYNDVPRGSHVHCDRTSSGADDGEYELIIDTAL